MPEGLFADLLIILTASVVVLALFRRARLPSILAYLSVGVAIGPGGLALIDRQHAIENLAEFGIVFLLFMLGLDFALPRLIAMRRIVLGLGVSQVALTTGAFAAGAMLVGLDGQTAFIVAGALALSSTAVVTKELTQRGQLHARHGRLAFGVLLLQDIASVFFLVVIAALAGAGDQPLAALLGKTLLEASALLVGLVAAGKFLLPRLFDEVARARSDELFVLTALVVALLAAAATHVFGLSMALGAFIAGMMLGESHYRHQIEAEIRPFRDILLGLFFVTIGMLLDLGQLTTHWPWVLATAGGMMVFKTALILGAARLMSEPPEAAGRAAVILSQGGEFGFAMLAVATSGQLIGPSISAVLLTAIILSMAVTPMLVSYSQPLAQALTRQRGAAAAEADPDALAAATAELREHVIIVGYGRVGQAVGRLLRREEVPFVAVDRDPTRVQEASTAGEKVVFGDLKQREVLRAVGIDRARLIMISFDQYRETLDLLRQIRSLNADIPVLVRTADDRNLTSLQQAGATEIVPETLEASLMLASHVLTLVGVPVRRVLRNVQEVRRQRYQVLHGYFHGESSRVVDTEGQSLEVIHAVPLPEGAYAVGRAIGETVPPRLGVEVQAIRRDDDTLQDPEPGTRLAAEDIVILRGTSSAIETAEGRLLRG